MVDRTGFNVESNDIEEFEMQVKRKPKRKKAETVHIPGENNFGNDALDIPINAGNSLGEIEPLKEKKNKRGRPVVIKDSRYKVCRPKMISPALESKLEVMKDYVEEFRTVSGRITFEMYIDTLVESYIKTKLGIGKEERLREEIQEQFEKIK